MASAIDADIRERVRICSDTGDGQLSVMHRTPCTAYRPDQEVTDCPAILLSYKSALLSYKSHRSITLVHAPY